MLEMICFERGGIVHVLDVLIVFLVGVVVFVADSEFLG